jgi:hypothetical protein
MRSWPVVVITLAFVVSPGCRLSVPLGDRLFFSRSPADLPAAADCERCHQEVFREWRDSPHALAWRNQSFQQATHGGRAEACIGCHAPAPLVAGSPPAVRAVHLEEGVTCVTCHLSVQPGHDAFTMRGPASRSSPVEAHPVIAEDPLYRSSELCGGCHASAFAEWERASTPSGSEKQTCQGCHMPSVQRKVESTNDEIWYSSLLVALEKTQDLRRHRFAVPEDGAEHLHLSLERGPESLRVQVENRLPHAFPTGRFGRRAAQVRVEWVDGAVERPFASQPGDPLPAGATRAIDVPLPRSAAKQPLVAILHRFDPSLRRWEELARATKP